MWRLVKRICLAFLVLLIAAGSFKISALADSHTAKAKLPSGCVEIMKNSTNKAGVYEIQLPASELSPFKVYCDNSGWTIIQRRQNGKENFYRNWQDYKKGFGNLYDEYWLGLDLIHVMTRSRPHKLQIILRDFEKQNAWAYYSEIYVASEADAYRLQLGEYYSGNVGDAMAHHNNTRFSTYDRNNSPNNGKFNCAVDLYAGFWFNSCATANLNGPYYQMSNRVTYPAMSWDFWQPDSLNFVSMAIREL